MDFSKLGFIIGAGAHWTGEPGITKIEDIATKVNLTQTYKEFYHIGSGVAHGYPEIWRMFLNNGTIHPVPPAKHVYRFSLCSCAFLLETDQILGDHFATGYNNAELAHFKAEHSRLMASL
jgi:hypothetical protein